METDYRFSREPVVWTLPDYDDLLLWAVGLSASDVQMIAGRPVWIRLHGQWHAVTERPLEVNEVAAAIDGFSRSTATSAIVKSGDDHDFPYDIKTGRTTRQRFRCNATASSIPGDVGLALALRVGQPAPPRIDTLSVEPEIMEHGFPPNGLVLITGVMGSGKSTLLAAMLRHILETQRRFIVTYEEPIEFDHAGLRDTPGLIAHTAVPGHLPGFDRAPRNAARRAADVILVGESRDAVTLRGMLEAGELGVAAYSTAHTRSVEEAPARIINVFPAEQSRQIATTLAASLRLIIHQRLVPRVGGGRVALRSFLPFTCAPRERLYATDTTEWTPAIRALVASHGQTLLYDANRKYAEGLIDDEVFRSIQAEFQEP